MHLGSLQLHKEIIKEMAVPEGFRMAGWVYILSNEFMPGIYKIGMTTNSPECRAKELSSSTGVPAPFKIEATFYCDDPAKSEADIHEALSEYRINDSREFFRDDLEELIGVCEEFCQANTSTPVEDLATCYDVISFETLNSLNLPSLYSSLGIEVFGDKLAIAERLIRIGAHYLSKNLFKHYLSIVFNNGNGYAIEDSDSQCFREADNELEAYTKQLEDAGIYGPYKPVDI